jgi:putative redox protein
MDMTITFPGGLRVDASFLGLTVPTDQPRRDATPAAPTPFDTFLASIGTCAGIYVLGFCRQRDLPTEGITLTQRHDVDPATGMVRNIAIEIHVPPTFPAKYHDALVRAADLCKVKQHLEHPPTFDVRTVVSPESAASAH